MLTSGRLPHPCGVSKSGLFRAVAVASLLGEPEWKNHLNHPIFQIHINSSFWPTSLGGTELVEGTVCDGICHCPEFESCPWSYQTGPPSLNIQKYGGSSNTAILATTRTVRKGQTICLQLMALFLSASLWVSVCEMIWKLQPVSVTSYLIFPSVLEMASSKP